MSIQIEEGKFYARSNGSVFGPSRRNDGNARYPWIVSYASYTEAGRYYDDMDHSFDLIIEVPDPTGGEKPLHPIIDAAVAATAAKHAPKMTKTKLLDDAKATVADRGVAYGGVEDNFARIARLWNAHLRNRQLGPQELMDGLTLSPADVAMMMVLMKTARLENQPNHPDSWTDIAGYAACGAEITA